MYSQGGMSTASSVQSNSIQGSQWGGNSIYGTGHSMNSMNSMNSISGLFQSGVGGASIQVQEDGAQPTKGMPTNFNELDLRAVLKGTIRTHTHIQKQYNHLDRQTTLNDVLIVCFLVCLCL